MIAVLAAAVAATMDWVALPVAAYDSDDGFAGGAVARVQWVDGLRPYRAMLGAQVLFSTKGVQSHYLRLDVPWLLGTRMRLRIAAEFHREIAAPYYGLGNDSSASLADHPGLAPEHAFDYARTYPQGILIFSAPISDSDLRLTVLARYMRLTIDPYAGSLLAQERPLGVEGGQELSGGLGLLLDRRDDQAAPSRGYLLEAAVRGAVSGVLSDYGYAGATARALGFLPLGSRLVLAARIEGDFLTPTAPLFELSRFGGVEPIQGVGGVSSLRGIPKARFVGRTKLVASTELRVRMFDARILERTVSFGAAAFFDTGRVWHVRGDEDRFFDFHSGAGAGLRLYHREMVVRLDVATSSERPLSVYFALGSFF